MNLLELPVDQYHRYKLAAEIVNALRGGNKKLRVLEIGGNPPKLDYFLPNDEVVITDKTSDDPSRCMVADALDLPFKNGEFDVAISLDVLEHIDSKYRKVYLDGISRVAGKFFIVAAPFRDEKGMIAEAEKLLLDFIDETHGYEHKFFKEHLEFGLPDLAATRETIESTGWTTITIPNGYFPRWFLTILFGYSMDFGKWLKKSDVKIANFYNNNFYRVDNCEPAYRHFIVASREKFSDSEAMALRSLYIIKESATWPPMDYLATLVELARLDSLNVFANRIEGLTHDLAARETEIASLKQYIGELEQFVAKIKNNPAFRFYERFLKKKR